MQLSSSRKSPVGDSRFAESCCGSPAGGETRRRSRPWCQSLGQTKAGQRSPGPRPNPPGQRIRRHRRQLPPSLASANAVFSYLHVDFALGALRVRRRDSLIIGPLRACLHPRVIRLMIRIGNLATKETAITQDSCSDFPVNRSVERSKSAQYCAVKKNSEINLRPKSGFQRSIAYWCAAVKSLQ